MRCFPSSWSETLAKLGLKLKRKPAKRNVNRRGGYGRRATLEPLESRQLLTGTPWHGTDLAFGDFDGDGNLDRLRAEVSTAGAEVWSIDTKASSTAGMVEAWKVTRGGGMPATGTPLDPTQVVVGDFNGDGRDDIFSRTSSSSNSWYMIQSRASTGPANYQGDFVIYSWGTVSTVGGWSTPVVGDFDGDGRDDLAAFNDSDPANKQWQVMRSTGTRFEAVETWAQVPTATAAPNISTRFVADFNGDGRDDIAFKSTGSTAWTIAISDGSRFNVASNSTTTNWNTGRVGDFDGDGADEILGWNTTLARWETLNYSDRAGMSLDISWGNQLGSIASSQNVHIGDANRDGRDDLVIFDATSGVNKWKVALSQKQSNGTNTFQFTAAAGDGTNDWDRWFTNWDWGPSATYRFLNVDAPYQNFLDVFSEVYNTVELELYPGLMKGIEATAQTKAGNDWDQAALLVERLEPDVAGQNEGRRARIATGRINVEPDIAKEWIGTTTSGAALNIIASTLDRNANVVSGKYQFTHAWVQALVPSADGLKWVDVDPSWKFKDRQLGEVVDLANSTFGYTPIAGRPGRGAFDEFGYLQNAGANQLPVEWYEDQVMRFLVQGNKNKSLADVPYDGPIVQKHFRMIPVGWSGVAAANPAAVTQIDNFAAIAASTSLSPQFTHRVTISIEKAGDVHLTHSLVVPKHSLDAINVTYAISSSSTYSARLTITPSTGGAMTLSAVAGKTFSSNDIVDLKISHIGPTALQATNPVTNTYHRKPGQIHAIGFDANQYSLHHIVALQAGLNIAAADGASAADIDELLSYTAAKYWYELNRGNRIIDGLMRTIGGEQWVGSGLITSEPYVLTEPIPGIQGPASGGSGSLSIAHLPLYTPDDLAHLQFPILPYNMGVDLPNTNHASFNVTNGSINSEAFQLSGYNASALENAILEEVVNSASVSTIRGLRNAYDSGVAKVWVYESVWESGQRKIYQRGSISKIASLTTYSPNGGTSQSTSQLITTLTNGTTPHLPVVANDVAAILENHNGTYAGTGSQVPIRILIPDRKSVVGNWSGSVYVAEYDTPTGSVGSYIIRPDGGASSNGGYSGNARKAANPILPPATFINQTYAGDPVNVANGNMFRDDVDFTFANPVIPLDFARHYDTQNKLDVGFGVGWVHSFTGFIYEENDPANAGDKDYIWLRGSGERHTFEGVDFKLPNTLFGDVVITGTGSNQKLTFQDRSGTQYLFEGVATPFLDTLTQKMVYGRLVAIKDASGNQGVNISYESANSIRVTKVESISSPSRYLQFSYTSNPVEVRRYEANQLVSTWGYVLATHPAYNGKRLTEVRHANQSATATKYKYYQDGPASRKGLIEKITEPNGESHSYEYYSNGRVFRVTDGSGNQQSFNYNLFRNLTEFTDERGNVETYIHQDNGLLTKQIHNDRSRLEFTWGLQGSNNNVEWEEFLMKTSTDERGGKEVFTYYPFNPDSTTNNAGSRPGELHTSTSKDGIVSTFAYNPHPYISSVTTVTETPPGGTPLQTAQYTYDANGNVLTATDAEGHRTTYEYYGMSDPGHLVGLRKSQTLPKGVYAQPITNSEVYEAVPWETLTDTFTIASGTIAVQLMTAAMGQHVAADAIRIDRIDEDGVFTRIVDSTLVGGDPTFRLGTGVTASLASGFTAYGQGSMFGGQYLRIAGTSTEQVAATWIFEDLDSGNYRISASWRGIPGTDGNTPSANYQLFKGLPDGTPDQIVSGVDQTVAPNDFRNYQNFFEYDTAGNLTRSITEGLPSGHRAYNSFGNVVYSEDATGAATVYTYDIFGRLVKSSIIAPKQMEFAVSNVVSYGPAPGWDLDPNSWQVLDGGNTLHLYDGARKAVPITYEVTANTVLEFDFEAVGNLGELHGIGFSTALGIQTTRTFAVGGTRPNFWTPEVNWNYATYQPGVGEVHFRIPVGQFLSPGTYNYLAFVNYDAGTTPAGSPPKEGKSYFSNLRIYESTGSTNVATTTYTYDASGRVKSTLDALGRTTKLDYDASGRVIKTTIADGTFTTHEYDALGNCTAVTDELGRKTRYVYDDRNRLIQTIYADGSSTRTHFDGAGQVVATIDERGSETIFTYDKAGRLLTTTRYLTDGGSTPIPVTTTNEYDDRGRLRRLTDAEANKTDYFYDALDRLVETRVLNKVNSNLAPIYLSTTSYDSNGRVASQTTYDTPTAGVPVNFAIRKPHITAASPNSVSVTVEDDGQSVTLQSEISTARAAYELKFHVTANTVLEFEFDGDIDNGSISIAIGNQLNPTLAQTFTLVKESHHNPPGGQINDYVTSGLFTRDRTFKILLGRYVPEGDFKYLIFINQGLASSTYSNLRIYDSQISDIDLSAAPLQNYSNSGAGSAAISSDGRRIHLNGDTNKAIALNYSITPNTVLEFYFKSDVSGGTGVRAFGLAHDLTSEPILGRLSGPISVSDFAANSFLPTTFSGFRFSGGRWHYRIAIGQMVEAGLYEYLVFVNNNTTGDSEFSDIRLFESMSPNHEQQSPLEFSQTVATQYDAFGRPTKVTNADGTSTSTIYDAAGRVRFTFDELGRKTERIYDQFGRLRYIYAPDPDGPGTRQQRKTEYHRDALGNVIKEWESFGAYEGSPSVWYADSYSYDVRNRLLLTKISDTRYANGDTTTVAGLGEVRQVYDPAGQLVATIDQNGNADYTRYDLRGRAIATRLADPDGTGPQRAPVTTTTYDAAGNVETTTDPLGNVTKFAYDNLNRLVKQFQTQTLIVDDVAGGSSSFSTSSGAETVTGASSSFGNDATYIVANGSQIRQVEYTFADLDAGNYVISLTSNVVASSPGTTAVEVLIGNAPYLPALSALSQLTVANEFHSVHGEQRIAWRQLPVAIPLLTDGNIKVRLSTNSGFLLADAVRIDRVVSTSYFYDKNGNRTSVTDTLGNTTSYLFDELSRQTKVTTADPDGLGTGNLPLATETVYDGYGNVVAKRQGTQLPSAPLTVRRTDTFQYDRRNRLVKEVLNFNGGTTSADNVTTQYEYDAVGNTTKIIDAEESATYYRYDDAGNLIDEYRDFGAGRQTSQILQLATPVTSNPSAVTRSLNNTAVTLSGSVWAWVPITPTQITHRTVLEFKYQPQDDAAHYRVVGFDTNASKAGESERDRYFQVGGTALQSLLYNPDFHMDFHSETLPDGGILVHIPIGQYLIGNEKAGLVINHLAFLNSQHANLDPNLNSQTTYSNVRLFESNEVRTVRTYDTRGNLETVRDASDPRNITTRYEYDRLSRLVRTDLDDGDTQEIVRTTTYDNVGNVVKERNDTSGTETVHAYDRLNRRVRTTLPDPDGNPATVNGLIRQFTYDAVGNLVAHGHGAHPLFPSTFVPLETTRTIFDQAGRAIVEVDGNGDETHYRYDSEGNLLSVTDAEDNTTTYKYDRLNRLTSETITAAVNSVATPLTRTYIYDTYGNLGRIFDRNNRHIHYEYDLLDRRITEYWRPTAFVYGEVPVHVMTWNYDKLGRVTKQVDGNASFGSTSDDLVDTFVYDGLGRIVEQRNYDPATIATQGQSSGLPRIRQTYEYAFYSGVGLFNEATTRKQFLVSGSTQLHLGQTYSQYDRHGRLDLEGDFDPDSSIATPQIALKVAYFQYDTSGNLTSIARHNSPTSTLAYDKANRVTSITHNSGIVHTYGYDNASRVTSFNTAGQHPATRTFGYDTAGQLTSKTGGTAESYTYDDNGNRVTVGGQSVYTGLGNRLINDGTYGYIYDKEGNVVRRVPFQNISTANPVVSYFYDHRNRLTSVRQYASWADAEYAVGGVVVGQNATHVVDYTYDAQGRRVKRVVDANGSAPGEVTTETFVYDSNGSSGDQLSMRFSGATGSTSELTHRYLYGPAADQVLADETFKTVGTQRVTDEVLWQLADQQGTVRNIINSFGEVRKRIDYDSFGQITNEVWYDWGGYETGPDDHQAVDQLFYYTGQERDAATGHQKHGARWYNPQTGRWLSEDPSGFDGGDANLYRYVGNGPLNGIDPSGLIQAGNPLANLNLFAGGYTGGAVSPYKPPSSAIASGFKAIGNSVLNSGINLVNNVYSTGVNLTNNFGEISRLYTQSNTLTSQLAGVEQARAHRNQFPQAARFGPSSSALNTQYNTLASQRLAVDANIQNIITTSIFGGPRAELVSNPGGTQYNSVAGYAARGLGTGTKAITNAAVSTATIGYVNEAWAVNDFDRRIANYDASRAIAGASFEVLAGVGTGGLATYSKAGSAARYIGKGALAFDTASNVVNVGRGVGDAYNNGLSFSNSVQIVGSGLGLGGNYASSVFRPNVKAVVFELTPSNAIGREGQNVLSQLTGAAQNTQKYAANGRNLIPDQVLAVNINTRLPVHVAEAKNVKYQAYTQQLRNYAGLVGPQGRVDVYLPPYAKVSGPLQKAFDNPDIPLFRSNLVP